VYKKGLKIKKIKVEYNPFFGNTEQIDILIKNFNHHLEGEDMIIEL